MTRCLAIAALLVGTLAALPARAGTPFGGDDAGTISSDPAAIKYENKVGKTLGKLNKCVLKCHVTRATGKKVTNDSEEDGCETTCGMKFETTVGKAAASAPASTLCLVPVSVENVWVALLDGNNSQIFCESTGTAFGGDDTGWLPSSSDVLKCQKKLSSIVAKLLQCQSKCHASQASGKITSSTDEDTCETTCTTKYNSSTGKLTGCPGCLNTATLATTLLAQGNSQNGLVYCAP
jgi:hypothetical protein